MESRRVRLKSRRMLLSLNTVFCFYFLWLRACISDLVLLQEQLKHIYILVIDKFVIKFDLFYKLL